jgi:8-oxo-dGTP pyrophosphatase MutT (NUDIX family)
MQKPDLKILKEKLKSSNSIIGKHEYFNSAVLVPLIFINNEYHLLFQKRAANIRQGGEICFPGGEFDCRTDNNFIDTAIRETIEELGISFNSIEILGKMNLYVAPMGVTVEPVVGILNIRDIKDLNIDKNEVDKIFTIPLKYFMETPPEIYSSRVVLEPYYINDEGERIELLPVKHLNLPDKYLEKRIGKSVKVYVYRVNNEVIWGITSIIVRELLRIMNDSPENLACGL